MEEGEILLPQGGACHLESSKGRVISRGVPRKLCSGPMLNLAPCPFAVTEEILRSRVSKVFQITGSKINKGEGELAQRTQLILGNNSGVNTGCTNDEGKGCSKYNVAISALRTPGRWWRHCADELSNQAHTTFFAF